MKICVKTQIKINHNQWRRKQARSQGGDRGAVLPLKLVRSPLSKLSVVFSKLCYIHDRPPNLSFALLVHRFWLRAWTRKGGGPPRATPFWGDPSAD